MLLKVVAQGLGDSCRDGSGHLRVAELGLGLPFKLGLHDLDGNHGGKTLAEVVARNLDLALLEELVVLGIFLEGGGKSAAEACQVCTTLDGVDVVDKRVDILVEGGVVGERHLDRHTLTLSVEMDHVGNQRLLRGVDVFHELAQPVGRVKHLAAGIPLAVELTAVSDGEGNSGVEEGKVAQTLCQGVVVVDGDGEYRRVGEEGDGGTVFVGLPYHCKLAGGLADRILLHVDFAVAAHLGAEVGRQGVDTADTHTVETARHLV